MSGRRPGDLDYASLRGGGLGARLRVVRETPRMVVGGTVAVLLLVLTGPLALVGVLAVAFTERLRSGDDVGFVVVLAMLAAGGAWGVTSVLRQAGSGAGLRAFARTNGLTWVRPGEARDYAEPGFADGTHVVQEAVRTPGAAFLEVGDRFAPALRPRRPPTPTAYLRARLGRATTPGELLTPDLDAQLSAWAGPYALHVEGDELTVLGSRPLRADHRDRVRDGLVLLDGLVARVGRPEEAQASPVPPATPPSTPEHVRGRRPVVMVLGTVASLVALVAVLAVVEQVVLEPLEGSRWAGLVVVALIGGGAAAALGLVRLAVRPGGGRRVAGRRNRS